MHVIRHNDIPAYRPAVPILRCGPFFDQDFSHVVSRENRASISRASGNKNKSAIRSRLVPIVADVYASLSL
jgi:hypothetical protein